VVPAFFLQPKKPAQRLKLPEQQYARINASTRESVQTLTFMFKSRTLIYLLTALLDDQGQFVGFFIGQAPSRARKAACVPVGWQSLADEYSPQRFPAAPAEGSLAR